MTLIDIDALVPWELTLRVGGTDYAAQKPAWSDVLTLATLEASIKQADGDGSPDPELEAKLRRGLAAFFAPGQQAVLAGLRYDDLLAMLNAASGYFSEFLKKKQRASLAAAVAAPTPTAAKAP